MLGETSRIAIVPKQAPLCSGKYLRCLSLAINIYTLNSPLCLFPLSRRVTLTLLRGCKSASVEVCERQPQEPRQKCQGMMITITITMSQSGASPTMGSAGKYRPFSYTFVTIRQEYPGQECPNYLSHRVYNLVSSIHCLEWDFQSLSVMRR